MNTFEKFLISFYDNAEKAWKNYSFRGSVISLIIHLIVLISYFIILLIPGKTEFKMRIVNIEGFSSSVSSQEAVVKIPENSSQQGGLTPTKLTGEKKDTVKEVSVLFDTTKISNEYKEASLNISIYFPAGWRFIDNKTSQGLDAIIFLPEENSEYDKNLSVSVIADRDGSMFNPAYYDSSRTENLIEYYFGSAEQTYDQINQAVYVKNKIINENFLIRLISPAGEVYEKFKPVFFDMVRSFRAGIN